MRDKDVARCMDSALGMAAWEGDNETVRALLDAGADVHAWADAPLWDAAMNGRAETMRVLLDAGADQDIALLEAAANGLVELVRDLLGKGADIHMCDGLPLMMAAHNGHTETVRVLKNWKRRGKKKRASGSQTA
jgi:ankyrin repeat protein